MSGVVSGAAGVLPGAGAPHPVTLSPSGLAEAAELPADPFALLTDWLPANDDPARPLMTLGTVAPDGFPDARTVLLSEFDERGFYLHTDSRSRKVGDLATTPRASLTLVWPGRQLVVQGVVAQAPADEERAAYARRSRYLQLLAWLNTDEFAALPLEERLASWAAFDAAHPSGGLEAPSTWMGFVVQPVRLTFWEGRPETAGIRTEFRRESLGAAWSSSTLAG
ncbi:pyridoxine/pyridoxamine 5'-phosphate oxidase [Herbiconiux liukaitaii]|uniref:pyridoxine/pyridoxamine 5'-phosphate oxidase n=1 Tax=Herbiconiux liukaitaii TaxID=3342799 RepID=UPI0035B9AA8E